MSVVKPLKLESSEKDFVENSQLKIATYNLFNYLEPPSAFYEFDRIYSTEQWCKKQQWISDYLDEHQPDIIGFQEVFSPESLQSLVNEQGYQYFSVVDQPQVIDEFIFRSPVVAIASKYPIVEIVCPEPDSELAASMGLSDNFSFSRKLLRATIKLPHIGNCDCYVVHLKSQRSMIEFEDNKELTREKSAIEELKCQIRGKWASSIQRGSEAALLMVSMITRREQTSHPMVLMGDFNNSIHTSELKFLLTNSLAFTRNKEANDHLGQYYLKDSWELHLDLINPNLSTQQKFPRKPTHYHANKGAVLDYVLLSCEFDVSFQGSLFEISSYQVYDRHLINPIFERDSQSTDHGIVSITLSLRN